MIDLVNSISAFVELTEETSVDHLPPNCRGGEREREKGQFFFRKRERGRERKRER